MRRLPTIALLWVLGTMVFYSGPPASGQAVTGSITGYVTDPSGAAIPNAKVTATQVGPNVATSRTSDAAGLYLITNLLPGTYTISVEAQGFKTFTQRDVQLEVGATARTDAKLELGQVSQQVTVEAQVAALETEKTDVSRSFTAREVEALPIDGQNVTQLFTLVPGAVKDTFQMGEGENPSQNNRVFVNGTWSGAQTYTLDGVSDVAYGFAGVQVIVPIQDSVQEMKITTADYDPEFGQTAGMVAQYITKSGTNQLHGSAFYYNRNSDTFAADPLTEKIAGTGPNGKGLGVAPSNFNQWGYSAGGPVKKDKVFLFGAMQWNRLRQGSSLIATVPNEAFRTGDFSSLASTYPIYDPTTGNPTTFLGRQQFSYNGVANVIPPSRIDPVAQNLLAILPMPNTGGAGATDNNYVGNLHEVFNQWQTDTRGDIDLSEKDKFFARYSIFKTYLSNPPLFGVEAGGPSGGSLSPEIANTTEQQSAVNWTHTFGGTLLTEARFGISRFRLDALQADSALETNNKVGIPNINTGDPLSDGLAGITVAGPVGSWTMGITSGVGIPRFDRTTNIEGIDNWSWMHGAHQVRFGLDVVRERFNFESVNASSRGNFNFNQTITGVPGITNSGLGMATFLLGMPNEFDRAIFTQFPEERQTRWGIYGQDTWHATKKLTLSLGLRWDKYTPVTPGRPGGIANFDLATGNILLGGLGNVPSSTGVYTPNTDFAPRLGIAYQLTDKTVIRTGLGRSYFSSGYDATFYHLTSFYPIVAQQTINPASDYQDVFPLDQGPPPSTPPSLPSSGILPAVPGQLLKSRPFDWKTETMDSWNFTVEHQLSRDTTVSVAYVGSKGTHLSWSPNVNAANFGPAATLQARQPYTALYDTTGGIAYECNCSDSNYNSLQIAGRKAYSKNLAFTANFTWQKALGYNTDDPFDSRLDYGPGMSNIGVVERAATFTLGHTIILPYGKGQRWGSSASPVLQAALGGWEFSGTTVLESGGSLTPYSSAPINANITQRPNMVPGCNPANVPGGRNRNEWYNPACYTEPNAFQIGDAGPGSLRGPGVTNADFALWKDFDLSTFLNRERTTIQIRVESFNVFNLTNLGSPQNATWIGTTVDSSAGPVITSLEPGFPMRRFQFGAHMSW
ncbi:MAG TPA: TonB-dependent receptor [Terriglobia bacterium]|nr:TonB-dependent receptor [Terriglobia bacterium]